MKKNISLIIKGLTLVSIVLLVFIGFSNNKNKTYTSKNKDIEIYIAPSDEYNFEEVLYNFDYFKMDSPMNDVKVVVYEKNKVLEMYNKRQKLEVYYQNNFYYIIKIEK